MTENPYARGLGLLELLGALIVLIACLGGAYVAENLDLVRGATIFLLGAPAGVAVMIAGAVRRES